MSRLKSLILPRRQFIQSATAISSLVFAPQLMAKSVKLKGARSLALHNLHTGERARVDYWIDGAYEPEALAEISKVLKDHRSNQVHVIDKRLIDKLYRLQKKLNLAGKEYEIVSGYRSPETNAKLRKSSGKVAKKSYHMQGKAVDVQLPGLDSRKLFSAAKSLKSGGVGFYGKDRFVHLDVGAVRSWGRK